MSRLLAALTVLTLSVVVGVALTARSGAQEDTWAAIAGGPGSVTINGKIAPPRTLIESAKGHDDVGLPRLVQGSYVKVDGSWVSFFDTEWEDVQIYVDGFLVPNIDWNEFQPGHHLDIELHVGVDTDPTPAYLIAHVDQWTRFGVPQSAHAVAELCLRDGAGPSYDCSFSVSRPLIPTAFHIWPGIEEPYFTINGDAAGITGGGLTAEHAPLRLTLNVGEPGLMRLSGDVAHIHDLRHLCGSADSGQLYIHAETTHWSGRTSVPRSGEWVLNTPLDDGPVHLWASAHPSGERLSRPVITYEHPRLRYSQPPTLEHHFRESLYVLPITQYRIDLTIRGQPTNASSTLTVEGPSARGRSFVVQHELDAGVHTRINVTFPPNTPQANLRLDSMPGVLRRLDVRDAEHLLQPISPCTFRFDVEFNIVQQGDELAELDRLFALIDS